MARQRPDLDVRFRHSKLHKYLLADENVIVAQRMHWAALWKPIAIGLAGLIVVVTLNIFLTPGTLTDLLWWVLLGLAFWAGGKWIVWRRSWLVATDKRVMVNYGLFNQGVAMFSLSRVPDLTYTRSTIGQILGYGELEREGTGSGQTLHKVRFVEHPHSTYTTICAAIFDLQDRMFGMDEDESDHRIEEVRPPHAPGLYAGNTSPSQRPGPGISAVEDYDSEGIQIHYGVSRHYDRDPWHLSADLRDSSLRDADTGPIPFRPSATDEGEWRSTTGYEQEDRDHDLDRDHDEDRDHDKDRDQRKDRNEDRDHDKDRDQRKDRN